MMLALALLVGLTTGQHRSPTAPVPAPGAALDKALAELAAEKAELRAALDDARSTAEAARAADQAARNALASELVALELERLALVDALRLAHDEAQRAHDELEVTRAAHDQARAAVGTLVDRARLHAAELPAAGAHRAAASAADAALAEGAPQLAFERVAALLEALDVEAQAVSVGDVELRAADGRAVRAERLAIGHIATAYRAADGRVGLAFAAPRRAEGYRWREDLPPEFAASWRRAFNALPGALPAALPLDVTGELSVDDALTSPSLAGRFRAGGPIMWPLAALAALCALLLGERGVALFVRDGRHLDLGERVAGDLHGQAIERANERIGRARGTVGRAVGAVWRHRASPRPELENHLQEAILLQVPRLRRSLRTIAVLASLAPLLGLLGTITGIIDTFGVLRATGSNDPSLMAGGISEALLTTATGLVVAIPVLLLHGLLRARADRLIASAEGQAVIVLNALPKAPAEALP